MFNSVFAVVMALTFFGAVATMLAGVANLAGSTTTDNSRSTKLMALRVGLCFALLVQIIVYVLYVK